VEEYNSNLRPVLNSLQNQNLPRRICLSPRASSELPLPRTPDHLQEFLLVLEKYCPGIMGTIVVELLYSLAQSSFFVWDRFHIILLTTPGDKLTREPIVDRIAIIP